TATEGVPLVASATADSPTADPDSGDNSASATVGVGDQTDLAVTIDDGRTEVFGGDGLTYTITLTNGGPLSAPTAVVHVTLPAALSGVTFTPSVGTYDPASGAWTGLNLAVGGTATLTATGTLSAGASGTLTAVATVFVPAPLTEPDLSNNVATDTT